MASVDRAHDQAQVGEVSLDAQQAADVRAALTAPQPGRLDEAEALIGDVGRVTDEIERAKRVVEWLSRGGDPVAIAGDLDSLLGEFRRRSRNGHVKDALRLAHLLVAAFTLALKWAELVSILREAAEVAQQAGEVAEAVWALRELGALAGAAGSQAIAVELLARAGELAAQAGDEAAAAVGGHQAADSAANAHGGSAGLAGKAAVVVGAHKVVALIVTGLIAATGLGTANIVQGAGGVGVEIVAFAAGSANGQSTEKRGWTPPADAVKPGGTIEACRPQQLRYYIRGHGLTRNAQLTSKSFRDNNPWVTVTYRWDAPADYTHQRYLYRDRVLPDGRYRIVVSLRGRVVDRAEVTVRNSC